MLIEMIDGSSAFKRNSGQSEQRAISRSVDNGIRGRLNQGISLAETHSRNACAGTENFFYNGFIPDFRSVFQQVLFQNSLFRFDIFRSGRQDFFIRQCRTDRRLLKEFIHKPACLQPSGIGIRFKSENGSAAFRRGKSRHGSGSSKSGNKNIIMFHLKRSPAIPALSSETGS